MRSWRGWAVLGGLALTGCGPEAFVPGPFVDVEVTETAVCGLDVRGHLACFGELTRAPSEELASFALSEHAGCGLRPDGTLLCWPGLWGRDDDKVLTVPAGRFVEVGVGDDYACALDELGAPTCWGGALDAQGAEPLAAGGAQAHGGLHGLSVGLRHGCALDEKDQLGCWSASAEVEEATAVSRVPVGAFLDVDVGADRACAVTRSGAPVCWGAAMPLRNDPELAVVPEHQMDAERVRQAVGRHTAAPAGGVVSVSTWDDHACALREDQTVRCWGQDHLGQSGAPTRVHFESVKVGKKSTCGLLPDGSLTCWGRVAFFLDDAE